MRERRIVASAAPRSNRRRRDSWRKRWKERVKRGKK
jgi:hypothetical protein